MLNWSSKLGQGIVLLLSVCCGQCPLFGINTFPLIFSLTLTYHNIVTGLRKSSSTITSANMATNTPMPLHYDIPPIRVAVCLQRLPLITREKTTLEKLYTELQEQLEFEHSALSDYEVNKINMKNLREKLKQDEDNESLKTEVATLDSEYQVMEAFFCLL